MFPLVVFVERSRDCGAAAPVVDEAAEVDPQVEERVHEHAAGETGVDAAGEAAAGNGECIECAIAVSECE